MGCYDKAMLNGGERSEYVKNSFFVQIIHQQNATWQGTVTWVDQGRSESFRSALELIRLIDSTVSEAEREQDEEKAGLFPRE